MAHGTLDWGRSTGDNTTFVLTDLGEQAVRNGSIVSFDRRGDVMWFDGFENGEHMWEENLSGTGAARAISTAEARNGAQSELLTGGSDTQRLSRIIHRVAKPAGDRYGVEVSWNRPGFLDNFVIRMVIFDGANSTEFSIRWRDTDDDLQFLNSSSSFETFATSIDPAIAETLFHTFKLVGDISLNRYVRFIFNGTEYDLSANAGDRDTDTTTPSISMQVELISRAGQNDTVFVDDAIITQNES